MGFFHKLLGLKDSEQPVEKKALSIPLDQVAGHLDVLLENKMDACFHDSKNLIDEIIKHKRTARATVELIRDLEFDEDTKDRTYRPIITSKPIYVKGMLDAFKGFREEAPEDYSGLEEFYTNLAKALKIIQSVQLKQGRYVVVAFRDEVLKLGTSLNRMIDASKELEERTGEVGRLKNKREEILKYVTRLEELLTESEEGSEQERQRLESLMTTESEISRLDGELQELEGAAEYKEFIKRNEEIEGLDHAIDDIESTVFKNVNSIKRVLRKYEKNLERRGGSTDKQFMEKLGQYISDPRAAFKADSGDRPYLKEILKGLEEELSRADFNIDPKERDKTYSKVGDFRRWLKAEGIKITELQSERKALLDSLSDSQIEAKREAILGKKKDLQRRMEEESQKKKTKPVDNSGTDSLKQKIEELLSNIENAPVHLKL